MIFIDGSNLYYILKNLFGDDISLKNFNFGKFVHLLVGDRSLVRTYYYNAILDRNKDPNKYANQQRFFEKLKLLPNFQITLCRMQKDFKDGEVIYHVKEDDIHIAVDMLKLAYGNAYDTAILVSADGDFVPVVKAVKEIGKKVEVIGFEKKFSWHLKQNADNFVIVKKQQLEGFFLQVNLHEARLGVLWINKINV